MFDFLLSKTKLTTAKILVVDDEPSLVKTLQCRLEANNYQVITACNGREAMEKALAEKPDIILLDIMMPVMDGLEMLEKLRMTDEGKEIAVIMLTACSSKQDIERANACQIEDYIVKPFDLSELLEKIQNILKSENRFRIRAKSR